MNSHRFFFAPYIMDFLLQIFGGGHEWKTLVHHGPIFIDYIQKQDFSLFVKDTKLQANDEQKYFFAELVRMAKR